MSRVEVDVAKKTDRVEGDGSAEAIRGAIDEAGYAVDGPAP